MILHDSDTQMITLTPELQQSLKTIREFLVLFPAHELENDIWQLAFNIANNAQENCTEGIKRANIFFIYKQLVRLSKAIVTINNELGKELI